MAVSSDRKFTGESVFRLLESVKGKTLGEVDKSNQFARTQSSSKITGIAGDVIEQSVFGYSRDSNQECDIEIDGILTELKTTGVRVSKSDMPKAIGKSGQEYYTYLGAKEGISITAVTLVPDIQRDFATSHFWEKAQRILFVFYEYKSYEVVSASEYAAFKIIDYCYNTFSDEEKLKLQNDWEIVRDYLDPIYSKYQDQAERNRHLEGFTHVLRPDLLLIELVPAFKNRGNGSFQKPRYRLKKTFVDYIVRGHFSKSRLKNEISLAKPFSSFSELDARCHQLSSIYKGKTLEDLKEILNIETDISTKDFTSKCILRMFEADCKRLNQISDFTKAGIIAKTITTTPKGKRTEDMKLCHIDFDEWADRDIDFEESEVYDYFCEHSFLCPVFCEHEEYTTFEGFKRFAFDDEFIENEVRRTWIDSRKLIHRNELKWEYVLDKNGRPKKNESGSLMGAPNFPKSSEYCVFFRGGSNDSSVKARTESVNGIKMLPQFFWLKGTYITEKLKSVSYL